MGFFKKLIKGGQKIAKVIDPIGGGRLADPLGAVTGAYDKQGSGGAAPAAADPAAADPMASYYGDESDPEYGSLLDPFDAEKFYQYQDPGYWFRLQQGTQGLQNSAAAGSGALSGAALKDLLGFNQDMVSQEYGNAFNRYQTQQGNIFSRLSSLAQLGQNAAAGVGAQGTQLAGNAGQAAWQGGSAQGAGIVGAGNALGQGATNYWLYNNPQLWQRPAGAGGV